MTTTSGAVSRTVHVLARNGSLQRLEQQTARRQVAAYAVADGGLPIQPHCTRPRNTLRPAARSEVENGIFPSAEPGTPGAALLCQMMFRLRAAGIDRLWHWSTLENCRHCR